MKVSRNYTTKREGEQEEGIKKKARKLANLEGFLLGQVKSVGDHTRMGSLSGEPVGLLHELSNHQN